jgi:hypothetical protein
MKRALDATGLTWLLEVRGRAFPHLETVVRRDETLAIGCLRTVMDHR